jgi:large subunit ribosomal protein L11
MTSIKVLVEGGKATAGPPLGPALGPLGVNIGEVIAKINEKTRDFEGVTVPVTVSVDAKKKFEISVGKPPTSQLILKEVGQQKGSGDINKIGNLAIEQVIKIAKQKMDALKVHDTKHAVLQVVGTCQSLGVLVEGEEAKETIARIKEGNFDKVISEERTEVSKEKMEELKEELEEAEEEIKEELAAKAEEEKAAEPPKEEEAEKVEEKPEEEKKE